MKTLLVLILSFLPLLAADQAPPEVAVVRAACGPNNVKFDVTPSAGQPPAPQPEPGKALVYVVEQYDGRALNPTVKVGLDGAWVGANRGTSYLFFPIEPGEHHLCADWQSAPWQTGPRATVSLTSLRAESGGTYYIRARILELGVRVYNVELEKIDPDQGRLLVDTSPLSSYRQKK
jgi:hypothetical protein